MPAGLLEAIGRRVRLRRARLQLTARETAKAARMSPRFLSEVEAGRGNISIERLATLAAALGLGLGDLVAAPDTAPRPIALLGLRGAGKTSVGRRLARRLKMTFVELDTIVASRSGLALGELFSLYGEEYYRTAERNALSDVLAESRPKVIAVGGGLVTVPDTFALLQQHATTVWLKARPDDYWNRVVRQGDRRPMSEHPQAREGLRALVARREPLYRQADITVDTSGLTVVQTVEQLRRLLDAFGGL